MMEQQPIALRYIDLTVPSGATVQLTLCPATRSSGAQRHRAVHGEKQRDLHRVPGADRLYRESIGVYYPVPLDEHGQPRQFRSVEEYQAYLATRAPA